MPSFRDHQHNGASPSVSINPVLEKTQSQWLFTPSELLRTPSILEGMPAVQEAANRQKGVNFITQVGIMLKLPQLTLATASVYLHRFFVRHSMALPNKPGVHHYSVAATALFLATKVEENCRKMRELVVACCRVAQKQPNLVVDEQSKEYWKWRDTILRNEDLLLEALCFDLQLEQPYRILFDFLCYYGVQDNKLLRNTSWAFLNDSHITTLCLLMPPRAIAGTALYVGAKLAGITLPDDDQGKPWWEHLDLDVFEIQKAVNLMAEVYQNPGLPRQGQKDAYLKEDDMALFDRTRHAVTPSADRSPTRSARSGSQGVKRDREEAEGQQSDEWGAPIASHRPPLEAEGPSPKRQRRQSVENVPSSTWPSTELARPAVQSYPSHGSRGDVDDVQQRIDAIINASNPSQSTHPPLPMSRRPSVQPPWPGPPSQRRSSSSTQWQRPPSPHGSAAGGQERSQASVRQASRDHSSHEQRVSTGHAEFKVDLQQQNGRPGAPPVQQSQSVNDIDDAEKVDYGSEEGEL